LNKLLKSLLFFALLISVNSYGSGTRTYAYYDSLTYDLYTHQQWKKLTIAGNEALNDGYDYYYLRIRVGVAYYQLKNYRQSVTQFRKALQFNSSDAFATENLYFALRESGMNEEAYQLASLNKALLSETGFKKNPLEFIYAEGSYTTDAIKEREAYPLMGNDSIYGEENTYAGQSYFHAGAGLHLLPSLSFYLGYSGLGIDKEKHISGNTIRNHLDSIADTIYSKDYYYSFQRRLYDTLIPYKVNQKEFYASASWIALPGLIITPAFHYISGTTQTFTSAYQLLPRIDTAYYLKTDSTWHFFNDTVSRYVVTQKRNNFSNYVFSLSLTKQWRNFSFGLYGSYASLTTTGKQKQAGASVTWYPFGNLNLYETTRFTGFFYKNDKRLIFDQSLGGKVAPRTWLEGSLTLGNLSLYNEKNAFIAYNLMDRITMRTGANLIFSMNRHIEISLMYRFYTKEYNYLYYLKSPAGQPLVPVTVTNKYNNQSIIGGIKWKL
jgi:hypothetical protein